MPMPLDEEAPPVDEDSTPVGGGAPVTATTAVNNQIKSFLAGRYRYFYSNLKKAENQSALRAAGRRMVRAPNSDATRLGQELFKSLSNRSIAASVQSSANVAPTIHHRLLKSDVTVNSSTAVDMLDEAIHLNLERSAIAMVIQNLNIQFSGGSVDNHVETYLSTLEDSYSSYSVKVKPGAVSEVVQVSKTDFIPVLAGRHDFHWYAKLTSTYVNLAAQINQMRSSLSIILLRDSNSNTEGSGVGIPPSLNR